MANSKYQLALQIVGMVDQSLGQATNLTKKQMREIAKAAAKASGEVKGTAVSTSEAFAKASPGIDSMWGGLTKAAGAAVDAMKVAAGAATALGAAAVTVGSGFESAMSSWAATAGASQEEYAAAKQAAMEMGRETSKTASESANALEYMALAGWSVNDSIKALPSVLRLSEASGLDLARTSDLVTDSMAAAGVEIDGLANYLDIAATANNKSNQTAEQFMDAMIGVGGVMKTLKAPVTDTATVLGIMANRGVKGAEAGNALNAVIANMTTGTGKAGKKMKELQLSAFNEDGTFKGLKQTFTELNEKLSTMTDEEKQVTVAAIGGKEHTADLNNILLGLTTTLEDGTTEWDSLAASLGDCNGAMEKMAETKMDNLQGDMAIARSAMEDDAIRMYDLFKTPLREAVQEGTQWIYKFGELSSEYLEEAIPTVRRQLLDGKDALMEFADPMIATGKWLLDNGDKTAGIIVGIATAITTLKVAKEAQAGFTAISGFIAAMASNPVTLAIGGIALLGGAIAGIATQEKLAGKKAKDANLEKHFGNMTLSLEDLHEVAADILGKNTIGKLAESMEEMTKVDKIAQTVEDASKKISRITWKVGSGFQLTETDSADLKTNIDSMVEQSLQAVEQAKYTAHISVTAMFGENSEKGNALLTELDSMYDSMSGEVTELGNQLGKAYSDAMEDGIIDVDEAKMIQELQEKLAAITNEVSQAQSEAKLQRIELKYSGEALTNESFENLQREINDQIDAQTENFNTAYEYQLGALNIRLNRGEITQDSYDTLKADLDEQLQSNLDALSEKGFNYSLDTVEASYQSEIDAFADKAPEILKDAIEKMQGGANGLGDALDGSNLIGQFNVDSSTQDAIGKLLEKMQPQIDAMREKAKELQEAGKAIPESLQKSLDSVTNLEALSGNMDAMFEVLGKAAVNNPQYESALGELKAKGTELPEEFSQAIIDNKTQVHKGVDEAYKEVKRRADEDFANPITANARLNVNVTTTYSRITSRIPGVQENAEGSIVRKPTLSWVGEGGDSEGIIPINNSQRSADLYNQVGEELLAAGNTGIGAGGEGQERAASIRRAQTAAELQDQVKSWLKTTVNVRNEETGSRSQAVTYSPVFNISGSANESDLRRVAAESYTQFKNYMSRYARDNARLSY